MEHLNVTETPFNESLGVFALLTRLSEIIVRDNKPHLSGKHYIRTVNKARSVMYGILLGKADVLEVSALSNKINYMSPASWLIAQRFIMSNTDQERESLELDDAIREASKSFVGSDVNALNFGWDNAPHPILKTLICLTNSCEANSQRSPSYEPFSLSHKLQITSCLSGTKHDGLNTRVYPTLSPNLFKPPPWMSLKHSVSPFGGYTSTFPFNKKPGEGLPLLEMFAQQEPSQMGSQQLYHLQSIPPLTGPRELSVSSNMVHSNYEDEGYFTPMTEVAQENCISSGIEYEDPTKVWSEALQVSLPALKSWETLGSLVTHVEPPFLSAAKSDGLHYLSTLVNIFQDVSNSQQLNDDCPTSREDFTRDVFLLLSGIQSDTFRFDEINNCFILRSGIWLEGYCADDTAALCHDFLYCGTHFRRLEQFAHSSDTAKSSGLIAQSLMGCVQRWIQFYHGAVMILSSHFKSKGHPILLYEILEYIQTLKQQVDCLSSLCCTNLSGSSRELPSGVELLAHIYREACKPNSLQSHLLYSALKSCCEVYLQCLQKWIFLGECSNKSEEFFVLKDPIFSSKRDRSFWIKGFVLDKNSVPVFLQGLEVAVLDCGRAMNLLQLCNPQHPLCLLLEKRHPQVRCCLYKSDMEKVERECAQFESEAKLVCGNLTNVSKLLEEERENESKLYVLMAQAQRERAILRQSLKTQLDKKRIEMKEKQNATLRAQISEMQLRKATEKEQERIEDKLYLLECQRRDIAARVMEEEARKKTVMHYEELGKIIDKQNQHREWQMKRLRMSDRRQEFLLEDSLNLSRDYQLFDKSNQSAFILDCDVSVCELPPPLIPQVDTIQDTLTGNTKINVEEKIEALTKDNNIEMEENIHFEKRVDKSTFVDNIKVENKMKETQPVKAMFTKASEIKAKVLQIEYGLDSMKSMSNSSKPSTDTAHSTRALFVDDKNNEESLTSNESILDSESGKGSTAQGFVNNDDADKLSDLIKNRRRVLTEDDSWKYMPVEKKESKDSGIVLERDKIRKKVLGEDPDTFSQGKLFDPNSKATSTSQGLSKMSDPSTLSELQQKTRVLGDSGVETLYTNSDSADSHPCFSCDPKLEDKISPSESERPRNLQVSSDISMMSPLSTPHGLINTPVFTSPFKGTDNLPNGLPLASPLIEFQCEKATDFEVHGLPLMIDIADNLALKLKSPSDVSTDDTDFESNGCKTDTTKPLPNTSWLDSSLQTCLLLPLRVQYKYVSAALMDHFLVDLKLLSHLKSLRSYYLMQDGEFGRHLTTKLFTQMYLVPTPDKLFNTPTLNRIVKEALASSQGTTDPNCYRLALDCNIIPHHFSHSSPNVLDCITLSYKVKWPLNLLLTPDVLEKYNVIFLFLVRLKRIAWLLQEDFVALKNTARGCFKEQTRDLLNSPQYHQVQIIRHNMSQFVQATLNYVSSCVLHASWSDFASSLKQATTVDHIYNAHIEYIKRLLKRLCLLNNNSKRAEAVLSKILVCIIKFHSYLRVRPWQIPSKYQTQRSCPIYLEHPNFQQLSACDVHFKLQVCKLVSYLERLISPPNQQQHLAEYLLMLNNNGFYKSSEYLKHAENVQDSDGRSVVSSK
ncbi:Gamma-tubulin complex component 6 [Frankliniella fusca]|uniref:Gamma-tubulin complex component 6 n=1 Tax=Frankliniella fusca TaxID=407009 RepID=A0AAE1L617_9NEOP|nr:Gamma-tubulin complex component 6 [Frankliniella fusca]